MPRRISYGTKRRRKTFIREWREFRELSQEQLAGHLDTSAASVSRIEKGVQPYSQDFLESCAAALQTDPVSLLITDPTAPDAIWAIWEKAKPVERNMIVEVAKTILNSNKYTE